MQLYSIALYLTFSIALSLSEALPTTAIYTVSELHTEALQATVSEGLAQGPYMAARDGFEPMTLWSKGMDSTNVPLCPTIKSQRLHRTLFQPYPGLSCDF